MKIDNINTVLPVSGQNLQGLKPKVEKKRVEPSVPGQNTLPVKPGPENKSKDIVQSKEILDGKESKKAFFALDDNDNVVIRIVDSEGNLIKQIPPEEYQKTVDLLNDNMKNILHIEG